MSWQRVKKNLSKDSSFSDINKAHNYKIYTGGLFMTISFLRLHPGFYIRLIFFRAKW
jgi:hypothetical protein